MGRMYGDGRELDSCARGKRWRRCVERRGGSVRNIGAGETKVRFGYMASERWGLRKMRIESFYPFFSFSSVLIHFTTERGMLRSKLATFLSRLSSNHTRRFQCYWFTVSIMCWASNPSLDRIGFIELMNLFEDCFKAVIDVRGVQSRSFKKI